MLCSIVVYEGFYGFARLGSVVQIEGLGYVGDNRIDRRNNNILPGRDGCASTGVFSCRLHM